MEAILHKQYCIDLEFYYWFHHLLFNHGHHTTLSLCSLISKMGIIMIQFYRVFVNIKYEIGVPSRIKSKFLNTVFKSFRELTTTRISRGLTLTKLQNILSVITCTSQSLPYPVIRPFHYLWKSSASFRVYLKIQRSRKPLFLSLTPLQGARGQAPQYLQSEYKLKSIVFGGETWPVTRSFPPSVD